jgi:predicted ATP-grasp superfamily ATP-dependent carboligase
VGEKPAALVLDVGWVNGLAAIRSLGRAGVKVFALDSGWTPLGFRSRYATAVRTPDPVADPAAYAELVRELGDDLGAPAPVFPTHDPPLNAVSDARDDLGDRFLYPFPDRDVLARIRSKRAQLEAAAEAGVDTPRTAYPSSAAEAVAAAGELGFPLLVKPADPVGFKRAFRRQAFRCETPEQLERAYVDAEPWAPMVQELVPGRDDALYTVGSYLTSEGEALGVFCGRKLRQTPSGIGTCRVGEAVWVPEVVDAALRLLRSLGYHGLSQVELKHDSRDGRYKLMEVNARLWQWHGLAAACGVDLPRIAYAHLTGEPVTAASTNGARKRWAITLMNGERPVLVRPPYVDAVFARDDPKPALVHVARVARSALR